jgi:hypothetical protein
MYKGLGGSLFMALFMDKSYPIKDELAYIEIPKEYELIKQKKSSLSARLRKEVIRRYEDYLTKVQNERKHRQKSKTP